MLPIPRTAVIVVGEHQPLPQNAHVEYRFVDYRSAKTPEDALLSLQSDWCYQYDNLLLTYPPSVDANHLTLTKTQMLALDQSRKMARLTLPFRLRRLNCTPPGAGFGLTLLTALRHLNQANLPVDVALQRIQADMARIRVQHLLLTPGKRDLASCPALTRWQHRLKPAALMYRAWGNSRTTNWRRLNADSAVETWFKGAAKAVTDDQAVGVLWALGFPGTLSEQMQYSGLQALVKAVHDHGGVVRYSLEMEESQYSLAWTAGIKAPSLP